MVVNIHHGAAYDIYVGRAGKGREGLLGNPIIPGRPCVICGALHKRDQALLDCYRRWLWDEIRRCAFYRALVLACKPPAVLGCFCVSPDGSGLCHGSVLQRAGQYLADEQVREAVF